MRALLLAMSTSACAMPPVTQDEAIQFHADGRCQMEAPGNGLTRSDGDGYTVSPFPGLVRFYASKGAVWINRTRMGLLDSTPGQPALIHLTEPGATVSWCAQYRPPGRDECGPVPPAFLYDARKVKDTRP